MHLYTCKNRNCIWSAPTGLGVPALTSAFPFLGCQIREDFADGNLLRWRHMATKPTPTRRWRFMSQLCFNDKHNGLHCLTEARQALHCRELSSVCSARHWPKVFLGKSKKTHICLVISTSEANNSCFWALCNPHSKTYSENLRLPLFRAFAGYIKPFSMTITENLSHSVDVRPGKAAALTRGRNPIILSWWLGHAAEKSQDKNASKPFPWEGTPLMLVWKNKWMYTHSQCWLEFLCRSTLKCNNFFIPLKLHIPAGMSQSYKRLNITHHHCLMYGLPFGAPCPKNISSCLNDSCMRRLISLGEKLVSLLWKQVAMCTLAADLTRVLNIQSTSSICHKNPFVFPQLDVLFQPCLQNKRENWKLTIKIVQWNNILLIFNL